MCTQLDQGLDFDISRQVVKQQTLANSNFLFLEVNKKGKVFLPSLLIEIWLTRFWRFCEWWGDSTHGWESKTRDERSGVGRIWIPTNHFDGLSISRQVRWWSQIWQIPFYRFRSKSWQFAFVDCWVWQFSYQTRGWCDIWCSFDLLSF